MRNSSLCLFLLQCKITNIFIDAKQIIFKLNYPSPVGILIQNIWFYLLRQLHHHHKPLRACQLQHLERNPMIFMFYITIDGHQKKPYYQIISTVVAVISTIKALFSNCMHLLQRFSTVGNNNNCPWTCSDSVDRVSYHCVCNC